MSPAEVIIRQATLVDLDAIVELERSIFTSPWSRANLESELRSDPGRLALLAEEEGKAVGYGFAWFVADEVHLVSIGVREGLRGQGVGSRLLRAFQQHPRAEEAALMTLEVRVGNAPARSFYERHGFRMVALRPRYYPDNREDALIMLKSLPSADQASS